MFIRTGFGIGEFVKCTLLGFGIGPGFTDTVPDGRCLRSSACGTADAFQDREDLTAVSGPCRPAFPLGILLLAQPLHIFRAAPRDILETWVNAGVYQGICAGICLQMLDLCPDAKLRGIKR